MSEQDHHPCVLSSSSHLSGDSRCQPSSQALNNKAKNLPLRFLFLGTQPLEKHKTPTGKADLAKTQD